ncbi:MAG: hypothetical protein JNM67_09320 [Bacteroidetes bacterium]|nr:hypothetical protein [Bacteroidota bacterium]
MKKIFSLAIFTLVLNIVTAQSEIEKKYFSQEVKDTFKKESIVIHKYLKEYSFTKAGINDYKINVTVRIQYKLNDISALSTFSTMSKKNDLKRYELKQIKPNGKVNVIYEYFDKKYPDDGYDPADVDEKKNKEENIPLEDLEIGDIIDYKYEFTYTTKIQDPRSVKAMNGKVDKEFIKVPNHNQYRFLPFSDEYLVESYAVVSRLIVFSVPSELKLLQRSLNTNFKFEERKQSDLTIYECFASNIPAYVEENFSYNLKYNPVIKFHLTQTNVTKQPFYPYQFESTNVSMDDIVALGRKLFKDKAYISHILAYKKVSHLQEYQYTQNDIYQDLEINKFFKGFVSTFCKKDKNKYESLNKLHEYLTNEDELNEYRFSDMAYAVILGRFAKFLGLKFKMIATLPKYEGKWNEIISPYEITWGIHLPRESGDLFITDYSKKSNIYQKDGSLIGTDIISFDPLKLDPYNTIQYPDVPATENLYSTHTVAKLSTESEYQYDFVNFHALHGTHKYNIASNIESQFSTKQLRTAGFYGLLKFGDVYNFREFTSDKQFYEEFARLDSFWRLYYTNYYNMQMNVDVYQDYHFPDMHFDSTVQINDGDYEDNDTAVYRFKNYFKASGVLLNSDNDSLKILNLGNLITTQFHITNYFKQERQSDVYNTNLRQYIYNIEIEVPNGYKAINLNDFNVNFSNEAGSFKSEASLVDGKIVLKVTKTYSFHYLPKEKWPVLIDFLQLSEKFYQQILILSL